MRELWWLVLLLFALAAALLLVSAQYALLWLLLGGAVAFRILNGEPSRQPLRVMIRRLLPWWT